MEIVRNILVFVHLIGFATLFAGCFITVKNPVKGLSPATLHGALTQLVSGVLLVGLAEMTAGREVNHAKVGVKFALLVVITVLTIVFRKKELPKWVVPTLMVLTVVEAGIAVFW
jgi:hypothetical protein